jgi:hypothetical protein
MIASGCGALPREKAVPHGAEGRAFVPGIDPGVRTWGGASNPDFTRLMLASVQREREELARQGFTDQLPRADFLAISGGGADGAFGAGMICAWTELGTRPEFKAVTGISTGALTAPFVFAGPEYDGVLRELYTGIRTEDILVERGLIGGFLSDAMADTAPLWKLLSKHVDQKLMDAIAAEYRKGRLLVIGTTNLDARRAVLWNVGEIAASGAPGALDLVRKILIASAAIPAAFPPVLIDVEADGKRYQEMHVDGGAMTQVFLYPASLRLREQAEAEGIVRERRAYIIRNARLDPDWSQVDRRTLSIAGRAISALIATQGLGDLYRLYADCQRDGVDYNVAYIPPDFDVPAREAFDPTYMKALFERGYEMTRHGSPWHKFPPGFDTPIEMSSAPSAGDPSFGPTASTGRIPRASDLASMAALGLGGVTYRLPPASVPTSASANARPMGAMIFAAPR